MIELTYRQLVSTPLVPVLQKLAQMSVFDGKTAYRLHKINEAVKKNYLQSLAEFETMGAQFGQKDENGNFLKNEKGHHVPTDENKDAYEVELENFFSNKFEIIQHKLNLESLTVRFSPQEIAALEPLLEGIEEDGSVA